jgi:hypothetical protein
MMASFGFLRSGDLFAQNKAVMAGHKAKRVFAPDVPAIHVLACENFREMPGQ